MTFRFGYTEAAVLVVAVLFTLAILFLPGYDRPPIETVQSGFRGTGMAQIYNPRTEAARVPMNLAEPAGLTLPPLVTAGPRAAQSYQNIQVLGDLSTAQFLRLMTAITAWVSPDQGCAYCHVSEGFASDELYTKRVSRWMLHMTRTLNTEWATHTKGAWDETADGAGVNCWTCHRGNNVPLNVWYPETNTGDMVGLVGYDAGQNHPAPSVGLASLPADPFSVFLASTDENVSDRIRVQSLTALPRGNDAGTKNAEWTYALMIHMSTSLGVNCSYCHNTRAFGAWSQSPPQRTSAWYGIRMVQAINTQYILPTTPALPPYRIGAAGTPAMVNCGTCHQGVFKPLYGASAVEAFPSLNTENAIDRETVEPGLADWEVSMAIGAELSAAAQPAATPAAAPATETPAAAPAPATTPDVTPGAPEALPGAPDPSPGAATVPPGNTGAASTTPPISDSANPAGPGPVTPAPDTPVNPAPAETSAPPAAGPEEAAAAEAADAENPAADAAPAAPAEATPAPETAPAPAAQ
jgi:photosynthetic reaction center cytochrome c subunit